MYANFLPNITRYIYLIILFCVIPNFAYSQFPIGKNIKVARNEIKQLMKSKGFTFLKREEYNDINMEELYFSEEFKISISKNFYDNVEAINISTEKKKVMDKLKVTFNFTQWKYVKSIPGNINGTDKIYHYKGWQIRLPEGLSIYQFIVEVKEDD